MKDEDYKNLIAETKARWQPFYGDEILTDEDAFEIHTNVSRFMSAVQRLVRAKMAREQGGESND